MRYKNIRYDYLHNFFNNIIFKKKKNVYKYILIYNLSDDILPAKQMLLKSVLSESGFFTKTVKTKLLLKYLKKQGVKKEFLSPIFGNILIAVNENNDFSIPFSKFEELELITPSIIIDQTGLVFYSSFFKKLPELKIDKMALNLRNNLLSPLVKLRYVLSSYNKIHST